MKKTLLALVLAATLTGCGTDLQDCPTCPDESGDQAPLGAVSNVTFNFDFPDYAPASGPPCQCTPVPPPPCPPNTPRTCETVCAEKKKVLVCEDGRHYDDWSKCRDKKKCKKVYVCVKRETRCTP